MTKRRLLLQAAAIVICGSPSLLCTHAKAQKEDREGPFGLAWGSTADAVRALGAELKNIPGDEYGVSFVASKIPRVLSDQEATILSFGYDDALWRMIAVSKAFSNDPAGTNIQLRYQDLLKILSEKYGAASSIHSLGDSIFAQPQYFLAGIREERTAWYSDFSTPTASVQLSLAADDSSTGRWRIIYENKSLQKAFIAAKKTKEKSAL